ncbi:MAG TPA: M48 family metalloprotease, partial [Fimbriimonadaceae bacterium]|nr:M48 family metalloprotease [Fimbriimonadaceae bacterium]
FLRRVASKLMAAMPEKERQTWQFSFDVIDSKEVNAFALPGGPTFFYTGLLDKLKTEDELAGILGHELVHTRNQHWASAYADNQKRRLGITAILTILRAKDIVWDLASIGDDLIFGLPYSRRHETDADMIGLKNMVDAGYNPAGMANVFRMLSQQGGKPPEFLSTHPEDKNRVKKIEDEAAKMNRTFPPLKPLPWAKD